MKSYKELLNDAVNSSSLRKLTDEELATVKQRLLDMYLDLSTICKANNLCLMLSGGSVLGAVRHQGFIPWDDDLDLNMPRKDYDRLLELCETGSLSKKFDYSFPSKSHDSPNAFLQLYSKECYMVELDGEVKGIHLDVFPIEGTSDRRYVWKINGYFANLLRLIANMVAESGKWGQTKRDLFLQDKYFYSFMRCRQLLGKIFSIISHKRWICWYDSFVKNEEIGKMAVIPTGRKLYHGETLPSSVFFPVSKGIFEGLEVNLPSNPDAYLKNLYGDYMIIPSVEKRESHMIVKLVFSKDYDKKQDR